MTGETFGHNSPRAPRVSAESGVTPPLSVYTPAAGRPGAVSGARRKPRRRWPWLLLLIATAVAAALIVPRACRHAAAQREAEQEAARRDSAAVAIIRGTSRLFTAEATAHKTVTYKSGRSYTVTIAGREHKFDIPLSTTEATIPVSVTYKACIDLSRVTLQDISVRGDTAITVTLPDPVIMETAVAVDHAHERQSRQWLARGLSYDDYQALVRRAKDEAWATLPEKEQQDIVEVARVTASDLLVPQLRALGFASVTLDFRPDFTITREKR